MVKQQKNELHLDITKRLITENASNLHNFENIFNLIPDLCFRGWKTKEAWAHKADR